MSEVTEETPTAANDVPASTKGGWVRIAVFAAVIIGLIVAVKLLPAKEYLQSVLTWTQNLGVWGPVVVAGFYIVACVLFLPGSILTLGAGYLFQLLVGTITVSIGSTLGACVAFMVGRTFARGWIAAKVAGNAKFAAIDEAVGKEGFKIVFLTRLSPVFPFNLLNYAYGLTKVKFRHYALASWIGMIPGTVMYVYLGTTARKLTDIFTGDVKGGWQQQALFGIGLAVTVVVTVFVTRLARRALKAAALESSTADAAAGGGADAESPQG